jgi:transcriptional regulator NrdR family protein
MSICVECGSWSSKTLETRKDTRFNWKWRLRQCNECGNRWSTYELPSDSVDAEPINPHGKLDRNGRTNIGALIGD